MSSMLWPYPGKHWLLPALALLLTGCAPKTESSALRADPMHRAREVAEARLAADETAAPKPPEDVPARATGPAASQPADLVEQIREQVPDPLLATEFINKELATMPGELADISQKLAGSGLTDLERRLLEEKRDDLTAKQTAFPRILARLRSIQRPNSVKLELDDVIRRTLLNNNAIQVQAYNPAIDSARIVESEANFDAVFFTNLNNEKQNRPSSSQLSGTDTQNRVWEAGVRKLLSTGMQVQTGYNATRTETDLIYQTLNPSYFNQFFVEFRQPLLKNFGVDYNRSQIEIRKLDRGISQERLHRDVREAVFNVEQAYWRLQQARRNVVISGRLLTSLETILYSLQQRLELAFDVYGVQVKLTESRYQTQEAEFVRLKNQVRNAEDALKALMNDPDINFSKDIEIIPTTTATIQPMVLDAIGEMSAALSFREELHEARLQIEQAQIAIGVAKNQALPKLDVAFRYIVDGLGGNWDRAFSQLSENDFHEYILQVQFEWPIGARGGEAVLRQQRLRQAQAIANHRAQIENVLLETQQAIRDLYTAYDQIVPSLKAAQASAEQLFATQARMTARDLPNLQIELDAQQALATARQGLLQALADYNIAIINLERRKGTLLKYNNIVLRGVNDDDGKLREQYGPVGP